MTDDESEYQREKDAYEHDKEARDYDIDAVEKAVSYNEHTLSDVDNLVAEVRRLRALPDDAMQIAEAVRRACAAATSPVSDAALDVIVRRVRGAR